MGVKGESRPKGASIAKSLDADDDPSNIQKLIKKVIECTRCSASQAELALYDNDNNLAAAIDHIFENGVQVESWTELKSKKDKKKEDDEKMRFTSRNPSTRGRGNGFSDRGGRGRAVVTTGTSGRGMPRANGTSAAPAGRGRTPAAGQSRSQPPRPDNGAKPTSGQPIDNDENNDWKNGSMVFNRKDDTSPSTTAQATTTQAPATSCTNGPAPISFAAVAAAGARKEQLSKQQNATPAPAPVKEYYHEEPESSKTPEPSPVKEQSHNTNAVSVSGTHSLEAEPTVSATTSTTIEEELSRTSLSSASPGIQGNQSLTAQLKNTLGIGMQPSSSISSPPAPPSVQKDVFVPSPPRSAPAPPTPQTHYSASPVQSLEAGPAVEFLADTAGIEIGSYHFGFVDTPPPVVHTEKPTPSSVAPPPPPPVPSAAPAPCPAPPTATDLFATRSVPAPVQPHKPIEAERQMSNGDYSMKTSPPTTHNTYGAQQQPQQQSRSLSYAEAQSVSYNPVSAGDRHNNAMPKAQTHYQQQQQQQQPQQQQQQVNQQLHSGQPSHGQPPMYPAQVPYSFPYMNMGGMYSPGMRDDYATLMQQYPLNMATMGGSVDLSSILPQTPMTATGASQHASAPHRDHLSDMNKYNSGIRDTSSSVAPPPGFANHSPFMQQQLTSLFMQQYQQPAPPFMMQNMNQRQMYPQDDDRKFDQQQKMAKGAQATPPPHFNSYMNPLGQKKPPYTWNNN